MDVTARQLKQSAAMGRADAAGEQKGKDAPGARHYHTEHIYAVSG
jgi:hypothetical protein